MEEQILTRLIKASLWGDDPPEEVNEEVFEEMKAHAIEALPAAILSGISMPPELRRVWQMRIYKQFIFNVNYRKRQAALPLHVPYVILKGTAAAKYYPHPEYRAMGDIDIMTDREHFEAACDMLLQDGFQEVTNVVQKARGRHRQFSQKGMEVEVHSHYSLQNDPEKAELLDSMIVSGINPSHILPDLINGLTLIEHVNHHLEEGLGLRQIIDWMLYVDRCLPDEKWPEFQRIVKRTGHEKLAVAVTAMCVKYLGLPGRKWCMQASPRDCRELWEHVLQCGNFGIKQGEGGRASTHFFSSAHSLPDSLRYLQERGLVTWPLAQKYSFFRPFAWAYQGAKYLKKGLLRKQTFRKISAEREKGIRLNRLFDALGVVREKKGLVKYKDGKYVKD